MKKLMLTLALSLAFAPAVHAQTTAAVAAVMPPFGQDKPIPVPRIVKKTLANGLTVWVVPRDGLPRVDYVLAVRGAGFGADDPSHPACSTRARPSATRARSPRPPRAWAARSPPALPRTASWSRPMR